VFRRWTKLGSMPCGRLAQPSDPISTRLTFPRPDRRAERWMRCEIPCPDIAPYNTGRRASRHRLPLFLN
jgi:hypothetical protein